VRNMAAEFCLRASFHARKVLLHAVNLRHGTDGFTSPPRPGLNPRTLGPVASTLATRPPRATLPVLFVRNTEERVKLKI
jgi:hypothetical protein